MTKPLTAEELADLVIPEINGYSLCSCDADTNRVCSFHERCARVIRQAQREVLEKAIALCEEEQEACLESKAKSGIATTSYEFMADGCAGCAELIKELLEELKVEGGT